MTPDTILTIALAVGGAAGAAARVIWTGHTPNFTRKSIGDVVLGLAIGVLYPLYPLIPMPESANIFQKAVLMAVIAGYAGDSITNIFPNLMARLTGSGLTKVIEVPLPVAGTATVATVTPPVKQEVSVTTIIAPTAPDPQAKA